MSGNGLTRFKNSPKIDEQSTNGLSGTSNSLSYRVEEIEKHFHNREKWLGLASVPSGETHRADRVDGTISPFALLSGNSAFGSWVQIMGSSDTPIYTGMQKFDAHRYLVTTTDSTSPFVVQIATGESAGLATKIANEDFTEIMYIAATNNNDSGIEDIMTRRVNAGEKVWARCACVGQDAKTINFYYGIHEYIG